MYGKRSLHLIIICLMGLNGKDVIASPDEPLTAKMEVRQVVVDDQGREHLRSAAKAKPGDVLEYQVTYNNGSRQSISNVVATLPIPEGTQYVEGSAYPRQVEASLDGKEFHQVPLMRDRRTGRLFGGDAPWPIRSRGEHVPLVDYRTLRWQIQSIRPQKYVVTRARASLLDATTSPTTQTIFIDGGSFQK